MLRESMIVTIMKREVKRMLHRPLYMFSMILAPAFSFIFFITLMSEGLPTDIPAGVVDEDNSAVTRQIIRNLDAFQQTKITAQYDNFAEGREAIQQGKIYALYYIPKGTTKLALASKQPTVSFYTAASYIVPASLEYRDMRMMSEYASGALTRATLYAKGYSEEQAMAMLQPIKIEMHAVGNPSLNYSIYLSNILLPGALMLLIFQLTIYSIFSELKEETAKEWLALANNNIYKALTGKLLPHFIVWFIMGMFSIVLLYGYCHFPVLCGVGTMIGLMTIFILVSQAFGVFFCGAVPSLRWALSLATLWGVLSFPICGFSFPQMAFPAPLRALSYLFPLRHYFLIYVDQALNGLPLWYSWLSIACLLGFLALPFFVLGRLRKFLLEYQYQI